jgi:hypothetical protein
MIHVGCWLVMNDGRKEGKAGGRTEMNEQSNNFSLSMDGKFIQEELFKVLWLLSALDSK